MILVILAAAWLGGIATIALWDAPVWLGAACVLLLFPALLRGWLPMQPWLLAGAAAMALAGAARFDSWQSAGPPALAAYTGEEVQLSGTVRDLPRPGITTTRYEVDVHELHANGEARAIDGAVVITLHQYAELEPGATVWLEGRLDEPPVLEDFDYRAYLARRGVVATMFQPAVTVEAAAPRWSRTRIIGATRQRFENAIARALPEPAAAVAAGISLGRPGNVSSDLYDDYRRAGLAHILAVSGAHLSVLSALVFFALLQVIGRRWAIWPTLAVVLVYVLLSGAPFSVIRAGIMATVFLVGMYLGKQQASLAALAAAAIGMTLVRPATALDLGFQLSLSATAGLIVFAPWLRAGIGMLAERFQVRGLIPPLAEFVISLSIAASITTAPLLWVNFGQVPLVGPVSNVVVEPIFGLAFVLSLATAITGSLWETGGWLVGLVAYYPVSLLSWTASTFGNLPYASIEVPRASADWALLAYVVMAIPGWFAYRRLAPIPERPPVTARERATRRVVLGAVAGALVAGVVWHSVLPLRGPGELELTVLNVGQGDAILLTTPNGETMLVDGGPSGIVLARELGNVLPHWTRTIDVVALTHPQADHAGGLPGLAQRYRAGTAHDNGHLPETTIAETYSAAYPARTTLQAGDSFDLDGVHVSVLWPADDSEGMGVNDLSLVLRVEYGDVSILLTGDIERDGQQALVASGGLAADVLKVPHHGAATSSRGFFDAVGTAVAVIPVGEGNRFGHPAQVTLNQLDGVAIYRTDLDGRVTVRTDGERITVTTER